MDLDGDGVDECSDCDDTDASNYPGATEVCDKKDNNCDSEIDENGVCNNSFWLLVLPAIISGDISK